MKANFPAWIPEAILYQIYPQSFQDSNADGVGDFAGITRRLDYIASLGVNTLWLNPCFDSPFGDAGYDIRDFYKVAPRYGTEADLVGLFEAAHSRGLRVVLDLVAGHTSMDHQWFLDEAANPKSPDSNRYIWKNREFDPAAGPGRDDFLASFFWYQPALNYGWDDPTEPWQDPVDAPGPTRNRAELRRILGHWFDLGCDGFRVDMASSLVKGAEAGGGTGSPGTIAFWRELRAWMDEVYPDRALIAEWSFPEKSIPAGFHLDFLMHYNGAGYPSLFFNNDGTIEAKEGPCYFDPEGAGSLAIFRESYQRHRTACEGLGFISLPTANHDFQRLRCGVRGWEGLRPAWVFLMTQPGIPTIYYGDEIGMRFVPDTPPTEGSTLWQVTATNAGTGDGERAGTRTPMQWDGGANAGFSTASPDALYLPIDPDADRPTVAAQEADPASLLHFVRELLRIRRGHPALQAEGGFEILNPPGEDYPLVVRRELADEICLVVSNPTVSAREIRVPWPRGKMEALLADSVSLERVGLHLTVRAGATGYGLFVLRR